MAERELHNQAYIRFLTAVIDSQYVDVFVNKKLIFDQISFREVSSYLSLSPGEYTIDFFTQVTGKTQLFSTQITIESEKFYTLAAVGNHRNLQLGIYENLPDVHFGEAKMRFLHLAVDAPSVDFAVKDRDVVFLGTSFGEATDYLGLTPMTVDLELRVTGSKEVILPMPRLRFKANETYTIVLLGQKDDLSFAIMKD